MNARLLALLLLAACDGSIASHGGATGGGNATGTGGGTAQSRCTGAAIDPGPLLLRRLTNAEYLASVNALLGVDASAQVALFPADLRRTGFDNGYDLQTVSVTLADQYHSAAKAVVEPVFANATKRAALVGCDLSADRAACTRTFVGAFGRRAFRRPLASEEVDRYAAVAQTETDPFDGAALAVRALLESPSFLWRAEEGIADASSPYLRLTGYELATRLSFFLFSAPPDDALLDAAGAGELDTLEGLEARARVMLADPRAKASFERFTDQWFGFDALPSVTRTPALFPSFDASLKASMAAEVHALFAHHLWADATPMLDIYTTRRGHLDAKLATLYGVAAPPAGQWQDVDWGESKDRGGLFTTAGLLTVTARNDFTSPIQRGLYLRERVLCEKINLPAGGVPPLTSMPGESQEEAESRHTSDPACTGCHARIDPVGMGLERYDAIGALRSMYPNGKAAPLAGKVAGLPQPDYAGGVELGALLKSAPQAERCVVQHGLRWALARMEQADLDACALEQLSNRFSASHQSFPELVIALVTHDVFRLRRPAD